MNIRFIVVCIDLLVNEDRHVSQLIGNMAGLTRLQYTYSEMPELY